MMIRDVIAEFPYTGTITRRFFTADGQELPPVIVYEGIMDEHMVTEEEGRTLQTSDYIISIPLTTDGSGNWVVPRKGDEISINRYGEEFTLTVDNSEASQIGGVSIYAARNTWYDENDED